MKISEAGLFLMEVHIPLGIRDPDPEGLEVLVNGTIQFMDGQTPESRLLGPAEIGRASCRERV